MFFTALLFGTGVFLYYFPDDGAKIILPYLDHLHDIGVEANMKNKREKTKDSNFDQVTISFRSLSSVHLVTFLQAQRLALAREYMLKAKQLFSILIALSFASSIVSGTVGVLFGIRYVKNKLHFEILRDLNLTMNEAKVTPKVALYHTFMDTKLIVIQ